MTPDQIAREESERMAATENAFRTLVRFGGATIPFEVLEAYGAACAERALLEREASAVAISEMSEIRLTQTMFRCFDRLRVLGWREAQYAPKDGRRMEVIEAGSSGIHEATRDELGFWVHDDMDTWPSKPILWRELPDSAWPKETP